MPVYRSAVHGVSISIAYAEAMAFAPVTRAVIYTLEFLHAQLDNPIRVALNSSDVRATLESTAPVNAGQEVLFRALPLGFQLPAESDRSQAPTVQLWIDGVSGVIAQELEGAVTTLTAVEMLMRVYMSDDLTGPAQLPPLRKRLREIVITEDRVTVTASYADPANRAFPAKTFTRAEYPTLTDR